MSYEITVITKDKLNAGTNANVYIYLVGKTGCSAKLPLDNPDHDDFERGNHDTFQINDIDVGDIEKIQIGHDNAGTASGWYLGSVSVKNKNTANTTHFEINEWLEDDGNEKTFYPSCRYDVTVKTGTRNKAGTDANVYIKIMGTKGLTDKMFLDGHGNDFEQGDIDTYTVIGADIGEITGIIIGHDNKYAGSGWFVENVTVKCVNSNQTLNFPTQRWLSTGKADGKIEATFYKNS